MNYFFCLSKPTRINILHYQLYCNITRKKDGPYASLSISNPNINSKNSAKWKNTAVYKRIYLYIRSYKADLCRYQPQDKAICVNSIN